MAWSASSSETWKASAPNDVSAKHARDEVEIDRIPVVFVDVDGHETRRLAERHVQQRGLVRKVLRRRPVHGPRAEVRLVPRQMRERDGGTTLIGHETSPRHIRFRLQVIPQDALDT